MTRGNEGAIGLRVRLKIRDPDPGREIYRLPVEWITGTIIGTHLGVHDRIHYYVALDGVLELDTNARTVRFIKGEGSVNGSSDYYPTVGRMRRTNIISIAASEDVPAPPRDLLGPALIKLGHGKAELVDLIFVRPLPSRITLEDSQTESRVPVTETKYEGIGWAEVEVV
jgi:hypothetical protein